MPERCYNACKHKFLFLKPFGFRQDSVSPVLSDVFQNSMLNSFFPNNHCCSERQECLRNRWLLPEQKAFLRFYIARKGACL